MRIGMLSDAYKPHVSGITNYIALNKRYLEELGHEVYVFTFGDEDFNDDEPNIIRSPGLPLLDTGYYINLRYSDFARKLVYTMDVVHVHHPFMSGSLALRYCRLHGIPIIFTNHTRYDLYAQAYFPGVPNVIGDTALQAYLPTFCRSCDLVIAPSPGMREVMVRFGVDVEIDVVPNGVDLKPFKESIQPMERALFGYHPEDVILVYTGRLGPEKNLPLLLRAFGGVLQAYDNVRLLVIGDGPERDNLEDRVHHMGIGEHINFTGMLPYEQIPSYLTMADAFVTASVTEVHPLSVIEAMAAGLPVLGIASPGIGDTVQDGETGYLVREEELASFTAKMVRLVIDQVSRRTMGMNARKAAHDYAIERTTQLMIERYIRVVEHAKENNRSLRSRLSRWVNQITQ